MQLLATKLHSLQESQKTVNALSSLTFDNTTASTQTNVQNISQSLHCDTPKHMPRLGSLVPFCGSRIFPTCACSVAALFHGLRHISHVTLVKCFRRCGQNACIMKHGFAKHTCWGEGTRRGAVIAQTWAPN